MSSERLDPRLHRPPAPNHADYSPRQKANRQRAARNWWRKHATETLVTAKAKRRKRPDANDAAFITPTPDTPWLRWIDEHGQIHAEKELSAEELIRRWQEKEDARTCGRERKGHQ